MKNDINIAGVVTSFGSFVRRFHTIIFFLIVSGGLFVAIIMLLSIIELSSSTASSSDQSVSSSFDEDTITRLKRGSVAQDPPQGRTNPFVE